tara:strand:+ start:1142 stop:1573 length:432 start_codon:yes stop_codon:yes gene_type:complete
MATTTATLRISSNDLQGSPLSINATTTCCKAGTSTGLELIESGKGKILESDNSKKLQVLPTALGNDGASKLYLCNLSTDVSEYLDIDIHDTNVGRLYAGDWMFIPWSMTDTDAEIVIEAEPSGAAIEYEWACFKEAETLVAHS